MKKFLLSSKTYGIDFSLLLLRIAFGGLMLYDHGLKKVSRIDDAVKFYDFFGLGPEITIWLAVFAEVLCAALVALGLLTRLALVPLIIMLLVIILMVDEGKPFSESELAILFLAAYSVLFISGPGRFSIDALRK
jgi:putative oxidoreductase